MAKDKKELLNGRDPSIIYMGPIDSIERNIKAISKLEKDVLFDGHNNSGAPSIFVTGTKSFINIHPRTTDSLKAVHFPENCKNARYELENKRSVFEYNGITYIVHNEPREED
jgi:hypothetical protein